MRIALLSDIHCNEVALNAVLDDARSRGVDHIACLGDVMDLGPRPREVIAMLRGLDEPTTFIMGNHDAYMLDKALSDADNHAPFLREAADDCRARLSSDDLAFIASFVASARIDLGAAGTLLVFHGTPTDHSHDLHADTPSSELDALFHAPLPTVAAGGHTHVQMMRRHRGMTLVNPGSVGMPFREFVGGGPPDVMPHAEYAVVHVDGAHASVELRQLDLDRRALRAQLDGWDVAIAGMLAKDWAG